MALRTHFNQPEIGCPGVAEFTVQRPEALFDHITGLRQISVTLRLRFRQPRFKIFLGRFKRQVGYMPWAIGIFSAASDSSAVSAAI